MKKEIIKGFKIIAITCCFIIAFIALTIAYMETSITTNYFLLFHIPPILSAIFIIKLIQSMVVIKPPQIFEKDPLYNWHYIPTNWLQFKRKEYKNRTLIYLLKIGVNYLPIFILAYFIFRNSPAPAVGIILVWLTLTITFTIKPYTFDAFLSERNSVLNYPKPYVKIYKTGLVVNNHIFTFNLWNAKMKITEVNKFNTPCIQFVKVTTVKGQSYDNSSGEYTKTEKYLIPILEEYVPEIQDIIKKIRKR